VYHSIAVLRQFGIEQKQFRTEQIGFEISVATTPAGIVKRFVNCPPFSMCHLTLPTFGANNLTIALLPFLYWVLIEISLPYFFSVQEAYFFEFLWAMVKAALFFKT
jgi:hypothetical protein